MSSVNKCIFIGNLGKDPEVLVFESGDKIAMFSLGVDDSYKDKDGNKVKQTEWVNVVVRKGLVDVAEKYLKKGQQVYVEGKWHTRSYQGRDGVMKYTTELRCQVMQMLGKKEGSSATASQAETRPSKPVSTPPPGEDDLPF